MKKKERKKKDIFREVFDLDTWTKNKYMHNCANVKARQKLAPHGFYIPTGELLFARLVLQRKIIT